MGLSLCVLLFTDVIVFDMMLIEKVLMIAILVLIPISLRFIGEHNNKGKLPKLYSIVIYSQPLASIVALLSYSPRLHVYSGSFAIIWLFYCVLLATHGLYRYFRHGNTRIEELAIDFASFFVVIGGIWFVAARVDYKLFQFTEPFLTLTAIHFHYTAFLALTLIGLVSRLIPDEQFQIIENRFKLIIWGIIISIPLVAAGITFSPLLELTATIFLAILLFTYSITILLKVNRLIIPNYSKVFLVISSLSLWVSMPLAILYSFNIYNSKFNISTTTMVLFHGITNSVGFVMFGYLAILGNEVSPRINLLSIPFSKIQAETKMYNDYFEDRGFVDTEKKVVGMVDSLDDYEGELFDIIKIHPQIIKFYEQTSQFELVVTSKWRTGFGLLSRIYRKLSKKMGQMNFTSDGEKIEGLLTNKLVAIKEENDGRMNVRAWVRSYKETNETLYAAIYHHYHFENRTLMNIAFPIYKGNMTSVMRMEEVPQNDWSNLRLTTFPLGLTKEHEGIYLVLKGFPIRLPFNETIYVYPAHDNTDAGKTEVRLMANHKIWIFGIHFLTLNYSMRLNESLK